VGPAFYYRTDLSQPVRQKPARPKKAGPANGKPARRKKSRAGKKSQPGTKNTGSANQSRPGLEKGGSARSNKPMGQHCTFGLSIHSNALNLQALLLEKECLALPLVSGFFS